MAKKHTTISVEIDTDEIKRQMELRIEDKVSGQFDRAFDEVIREKVSDLVDGITRVQIEKAVAAALDEGWQATNSYGEAVGPRIGVKGRIAEMLSKNVGDYNHKMTRAEQLTKEVIDTALRAEFGKEIKEAREKFKAAVDAHIAEQFTQTIKSALGLR